MEQQKLKTIDCLEGKTVTAGEAYKLGLSHLYEFQDYEDSSSDLILAGTGGQYADMKEVEAVIGDRRILTITCYNTVEFGVRYLNALYYVILKEPLSDEYQWGGYSIPYSDEVADDMLTELVNFFEENVETYEKPN